MKKRIRYCDWCEEEIKNMYEFGVTTLFSNIFIGRGGSVNKYMEDTVVGNMQKKKMEDPDDLDSYGTGYSRDKDKEFSFCCPEHCFKFLNELYKDTYKETINMGEPFDEEQIKKDYEKFKSKWDQFKDMFSDSGYRKFGIKWCNDRLKRLDEKKKKLKKYRQKLKRTGEKNENRKKSS